MDIHVNRGTVLLELDRMGEAISSFDTVIAHDPRNIAALINRGNAYVKDKRFREALASYDMAITVDAEQAGALTGRGVVLAEMDQIDEALACHNHALRVEPHFVGAHVNRGNTLVRAVRMKEALADYAKALALDPENTEANFNAAVTRLCIGDYRDGWKQYEYRWKKKQLASHRPKFLQPMWRGERDLRGKTVLLHAEQGLGDTLQFVRYAPLVAALGAKVLLAVPASLKTLVLSVPDVSLVLARCSSSCRISICIARY